MLPAARRLHDVARDVHALHPGAALPDPEETIVATIRSLLARRDASDVGVTLDSKLTVDLELDSLELAELSATLEDDLGSDPYSAGIVPVTVGELVGFYRS